MKPNLITSLCLATASCSGGGEEYNLTNIAGWTTAQLATLPHFDRYVPVAPAGAAGDFTPVCSNGRGLVAGDRSNSNGTDGADDFTFAVDPAFLSAPLDDWRSSHFSQADLDDPGKESDVWGTLADPDGDGLPNDAELALGTGPDGSINRAAIPATVRPPPGPGPAVRSPAGHGRAGPPTVRHPVHGVSVRFTR